MGAWDHTNLNAQRGPKVNKVVQTKCQIKNLPKLRNWLCGERVHYGGACLWVATFTEKGVGQPGYNFWMAWMLLASFLQNAADVWFSSRTSRHFVLGTHCMSRPRHSPSQHCCAVYSLFQHSHSQNKAVLILLPQAHIPAAYNSSSWRICCSNHSIYQLQFWLILWSSNQGSVLVSLATIQN